MINLSGIKLQDNTQLAQEMTGTGQKLDTLMRQLSNALSVSPVGTYYQPSTIVPDRTVAGGQVPTVRRYTVTVDKIMIPYKDNAGPVVGRDGFLSGDVTEADLIAAGCNVAYLVAAGHIYENGFVRI